MDELAPLGRADVIEKVAWPLPLRVLGELLGFPREDLPQLHEWGTDWLLLQQPGSIEQRVRHARGLVALQHYMIDALEAREREPRDDLLGALWQHAPSPTIRCRWRPSQACHSTSSSPATSR